METIKIADRSILNRLQTDMISNAGWITISGGALTRSIGIDYKLIEAEDSFDWGYLGIKPQYLARTILALYCEEREADRLASDLTHILTSQLPDFNFCVKFNMGLFLYVSLVEPLDKPLVASQFRLLLIIDNFFLPTILDLPADLKPRYEFDKSTIEHRIILGLSDIELMYFKTYLNEKAIRPINPQDPKSETEALKFDYMTDKNGIDKTYFIEFQSARVRKENVFYGHKIDAFGNIYEADLRKIKYYLST